MPSERIQRRIDGFLDEADEAASRGNWQSVAEKARAVLAIDEGNDDALAFLKMADANRSAAPAPPAASAPAAPAPPPAATQQPTSFVSGRYAVRRFLGEGGKKRVFLAHDTRLDRDVAFAVIKTAGLDDVGRERITREAQAMGRLGAHPNIVTIFEMGEEDGSPFVVNELLAGGDVEGEMEKAGGALALDRALEIAKGVCRGLAFAHERGIVHRDLKPGNVWLTADGTAKIGDFGLAVSLDRSRLTQHGMMVGTVAYMPPEQALGGEVTPQADLYSLGAMLYELVTGKPPFQADDPTAVISQHINIAPVSPSWLSDHCPPELEELILRCLAKVPQDRPKSATEVLAILETIDAEGKSASHSDSGANPLDRLARGVFVGREKELERLRSAFDDAFAGRGRLVMLVGEPGIGKTRTAQELETYARMRGAQVLWGGSHEGSGAPPFWPWVQAGRQWGSTNEIAAVRDELAETRGELVRLFPELRANADFVEPDPIADAESDQFRLFDAMAMFVRAMQRRTPIVIALDDLHWADKPTLLLLQHIAREVGRMRVLILCTYRDTDLSRTHPLSEALAALNREPGFQRIVMRGLTKDEVANYITATAKAAPRLEVVERIFEETEGNPFFLSEVVNLLTQEGTLLKHSLSDIVVPDGVREALGRRLDRLSEEANALLQVAAIVGREFAYETLNLLGEHDEDDLLRLIERGIEARVIEELPQPGRYRFTHALMQETLLSELSTTRRVRLHGQVGEALEKRWGGRADERAPRLAEHFMESATLTPRHAERALRYATLAGEQAEAQAAWDDAAGWYERALTLGVGSEVEFDEPGLLFRLGRCFEVTANPRGAYRCFMRALDLYSNAGNPDGVADAAVRLLEIPMSSERQVAIVEKAVGRRVDTRQKALLLAKAALYSEDWRRRLREVEQILNDNDWPDVRAEWSMVRSFEFAFEGRFEEAREMLAGVRDVLVRLGDHRNAVKAIRYRSSYAFSLGAVDRAQEETHGELAFAQAHRFRTAELQSHTVLAAIHLARGESAEYERGMVDAQNMAWSWLLAGWSARAKGDPTRALAAVPPPDAAIIPGFWAHFWAERASSLLELGEFEQARVEFDRFLDEVRAAGSNIFPSTQAGIVCAIDGASPLISPELAAELLALPYDGATLTSVPVFSIRRAWALLRLILDDLDAASADLASALQLCQRERLPVELGRCHQGLAAVAERRGDMAAAREHLDAAGELFSKHGAKLFLDQVLKKKEFLKA